MVMAKTKKMIKDTLSRTLSKTRKTTKNTKSSASTAADTTATTGVNTTTAKTTATTKETSSKATKALCIDYPLNNDTVYCGHYCFRIGTVGNSEWVKVSVNGGPWIDCRRANGYWWYDWWNFQTGSFFAEALALVNGKEVKTAKRKFKVTL